MIPKYVQGKQRFDTRTARSWRDVPGWFSEKDFTFMQRLCWKLSPGVVVELGTWVGRSLVALAPICRERGCLYVAVDDFNAGTDKTFMRMEYEMNGGGEKIRKILDIVVAHFGLGDTTDIRVDDSAGAAGQFVDETVELCFVDAGHQAGMVRGDIRAWWPKIVPGGCLSGHDYEWPDEAGNGVKEVVDEFVEREGLSLLTGGRCWATRKADG